MSGPERTLVTKVVHFNIEPILLFSCAEAEAPLTQSEVRKFVVVFALRGAYLMVE
ncbi:hypothetical protein U716_14915 [Rhodobacter capsulatus B6]|nr:hypothetical protein U716_14915 [Rhodobacter capsulatus B6]